MCYDGVMVCVAIGFVKILRLYKPGMIVCKKTRRFRNCDRRSIFNEEVFLNPFKIRNGMKRNGRWRLICDWGRIVIFIFNKGRIVIHYNIFGGNNTKI